MLFCFAFAGNFWLAPLLGFLLLAYHIQSRSLLALAGVLLIASLSHYYYQLTLPLIYKGFLLLGTGVLFVLLAIYLYRREKTPEQAVGFTPKFANKAQPVAAMISLLATLGLANFAIHQNEDVLQNGTPIVLKLSPVDPRSLMQGDYMELDYAILQQLELPVDEPHRLYLLLNLNEQGVAELCRVEPQLPTDFAGCTENLYLPVKRSNDWRGRYKLPSHQFFFPEGKAKHYAQASYGEYRFKNGKVLLVNLLDRELNKL